MEGEAPGLRQAYGGHGGPPSTQARLQVNQAAPPGLAAEHDPVGGGPIGAVAAACYRGGMNLLILVIIFLLLFGGGGFYFGGPVIGGGGLGLILLICLIVYFMGGWRTRA
jgi:hypothetical protein